MNAIAKASLALFLVAFAVLPGLAAEITVDSACSLADAITAANTDEAAGGCVAGEGADEITLSADVTLETSLPLISSAITIEGGGHTISGANRYHIFGVNSRGNLELNHVILDNARSGWGGAIGNSGGSVAIRDSVISNSAAGNGGAIGNEGGLIARDSTFAYNSSQDAGGAIFNRGGVVELINSNFEGNYAGGQGGAIVNHDGWIFVSDRSRFNGNVTDNHGGALFNKDGTVEITDSVFSRNRASDRSGGAIYNDVARDETDDLMVIANSAFLNNVAAESGGAIYNRRGSLNVANSAFDRNSAGDDGGGLYDASVNATDILHSSFQSNRAENGGGIYKEYDAQLSLYHSIISNSSSGGDCFGRLDDSKLNLVEDGSCYAELSGDPMLGDLVEPEDGSPAYYPLQPGSPAIDAASSEHCPDTDQIGTPRPQGAACDIGAIEYVPEQ